MNPTGTPCPHFREQVRCGGIEQNGAGYGISVAIKVKCNIAILDE